MSALYYTTKAKANIYDAVVGVFDELFKELKDLGKKKPETTLSAAKVKIINRVLEDVMDCLENEANFKYLELLDDETLPQYSDAILILAQFDGALKTFRERHFGYYGGEHQWVIRKKEKEE
ncbi:hypothetical protein MCBMB27_05831 (plasmid) [Methylobacterium phyllosphaerae]|uniref:Uncharacterized protein n=1 Tax=Methylobacterium phyllosphaerae TaxID=418223 RepID=A0AAE8HXW3_9HYPH|nr:hypothetical protein [Methylobacterium phyllosphaerae]APT35122.1 hypothetical protein MCBMB27_05831 [Methylobacterium phyllosphaerae]SFH68355.1 hypothetical protein SAMN05192567_1442 [Methylobacterium phyllosphaerae]